MDAMNRRPWETSPTSHPQAQTLPSIKTLTNDVDSRPVDKAPLSAGLNSAPRDSGTWSGIGGSSSSNSMPYLNQSTNPSPQGPYPSEPTNGHQSMFSSINHSAHPSNASREHRGSGDFDDSRRGSVDSRIHQGMKNMDLGPTSPYNASTNVSQSSLAQGLNLNRERGIQANGYRGPRISAGSGPISPLWPRTSEQRGFTAGRVAPPILGIPRSEVYLAEAPTRGQAYAFPDPDARPPARPPSNFSRRNSFAESFTSSIFSDRSRLPPGQQELPGDTHHHSLQHRQVESLRGDPESPNSVTPYSRTPELRVTHKLAERKRRSEMKDCFEQLRTKLPANQNNKSSKWETLARAIEYIDGLEASVASQRKDNEKLRHDMQRLEMEMKELRQQAQRMQHVNSYQPPPNSMPQSPHGYGQQYSNGVDGQNDGGRTLPPIMNGAMQGVQYSDDRR